ncbi:hypothetical protein F5141DRAFT_1063694 [Pisolithus sp. B1]|nr:hypothetical protein F5141DRAFT_1063694 [Pisolithus sp. B1]
MSTSQNMLTTAPTFITPNAVRDLIPGMWTLNMKRLKALMKEILGESAEEETAHAWLSWYKELSCAAKPKVKPAVASSSGPQVGGEGTEGSLPAKHVEAAVLSSMGDTTVENEVTEVKPTSSSADPSCHNGKKKYDKAGRPGRKHKNPEGPPPESASLSKKAKHPQPQPVPLFLPSSGLTTPTPTSGLPVPLSSYVKEKPTNDTAESLKGSSEFLGTQIDSCRDEEAPKVESSEGREMSKIEIDLTETEEILTPRETT